MSDPHAPHQVVRPLRKNELPPAYTTEELFRGVCHVIPGCIPKERITKPQWIAVQIKEGQAKSRQKFLDNREAIYKELKTCKVRTVADRFHIGKNALKRFLEEEKNER